MTYQPISPMTLFVQHRRIFGIVGFYSKKPSNLLHLRLAKKATIRTPKSTNGIFSSIAEGVGRVMFCR